MTDRENQPKKSDIALREEKTLAFWKENNIFQKTLEKKAPKGQFVFYDGPPFATGLPHYGSLLGSIAKDVFGRYKTMQGYQVRRRWGWDCHGLPIENMIEKRLELGSKKEIEEMGIEKFNETCRSAVLQYTEDWEWYVDRVGRWVEFENSYKTMDATYSESVWWAIKQIHDKGLLYEGRKVLLYCPRCETPLAKAEVAMDNSYKDVSEEAVTVKFELEDEPNTFVLAWTTTPWTLPGNVALAVGKDIEYVKIDIDGAKYILAKERLEVIKEDHEVIETFKGSDLVGKAYKGLYPFPENIVPDDQKENYTNAYKIYDANFVTTEDGTGVVHTAVLYGEDDYMLGQKIGLPMVQLLDSRAHFLDTAPEIIRGAFFKQSEKLIKQDLRTRELLFAAKNHTHSYPHCHRCDTPLIYNAISSWFINIQKVKSKLQKNNEDINWIPDHLKHGRFGKIVDSAPDWTISRNRYWATPLPVWKGKQSGKVYVMGGLEDLKSHVKKSGNTYITMRHGEAKGNVTGHITTDITDDNPLTEKGIQQSKDAARKLGAVDIIITSPFVRTKESATIVAGELGLDESKIIVDERIGEIQMGEWENRTWDEFFQEHDIRWHFNNAPQGGESRVDVVQRVGEFLYDLEKKYSNKKILIVTHGACLGAAHVVAKAISKEHAIEIYSKELGGIYKTGEFHDFGFIPLPHNGTYELDFHRPYIDQVELVAPGGEELERVPEVLDGWVDSATMPFAEYHYPFENKQEFEKRFPGDYVAEYIAQTRTWFYYMHVMGNILFGKAPFKNVLTTGNIQAEDGAKMSKSKGNYTDPTENFNNVGADAMRYYLMTSVVMQAEDVRFVDREMVDVKNRLLNILSNVVKFYELYKPEEKSKLDVRKSPYVLDQWILALLDELIKEVTENLDAYNTVKGGRPLGVFVKDLSQWYIRRSRDRFKGDDQQDKEYALATTQHVLIELSKLLAPFAPFIAEDVYKRAGGERESVHLEDWPKVKKEFRLFKKKDTTVETMDAVRKIISAALEARDRAGIKVRQPLQSLTVTENFDEQYLALIQDEVNLKEVVVGDTLRLDTTITPELAAEGHVRELIRHIQSMRKKAKLEPSDNITLSIDTAPEGKKLISDFEEEIKKTAGLQEIIFNTTEGEKLIIEKMEFTISIT